MTEINENNLQRLNDSAYPYPGRVGKDVVYQPDPNKISKGSVGGLYPGYTPGQAPSDPLNPNNPAWIKTPPQTPPPQPEPPPDKPTGPTPPFVYPPEGWGSGGLGPGGSLENLPSLVNWPDIYEDHFDYLEYAPYILASNFFWRAFINVWGSVDTAYLLPGLIGLARLRDPMANPEDLQLRAWSLASKGLTAPALLSTRSLNRMDATYGQYVRERGNSYSFLGWISYCTGTPLLGQRLAIAKSALEDTYSSQHSLAQTAPAGSKTLWVRPALSTSSSGGAGGGGALIRYTVVLPNTTAPQPVTVLRNAGGMSEIALTYPTPALLLRGRVLTITAFVSGGADSTLDINTLSEEAVPSLEGPYYPSPYYQVIYDTRTAPDYVTLRDLVATLQPIHLVMRALTAAETAKMPLVLGAVQALETETLYAVCMAKGEAGRNQAIAAGAERFLEKLLANSPWSALPASASFSFAFAADTKNNTKNKNESAS